MNEYHIFPSSPDAADWKPSFTVRAVSDEAVKEAFPSADRIYRSVNLICTEMVRVA